MNNQKELLQALLELKVIKRDGRDLFFRLEEVLGDIGKLKRKLEDGDEWLLKHSPELIDEQFRALWPLVYELQTLMDVGEI